MFLIGNPMTKLQGVA